MIGFRAPLVAMSVIMLSGVALAQGVPVAQVQAIPSAPNQAAQPAEQAAPAPAPAVDETALRYFARQGDQRRKSHVCGRFIPIGSRPKIF